MTNWKVPTAQPEELQIEEPTTCRNNVVGDIIDCEGHLLRWACLGLVKINVFVKRATENPITKENQEIMMPLICENSLGTNDT